MITSARFRHHFDLFLTLISDFDVEVGDWLAIDAEELRHQINAPLFDHYGGILPLR